MQFYSELPYYTYRPFTENMRYMIERINSTEDPLECTLITRFGAGNPKIYDLRDCVKDDFLTLDHPDNIFLGNPYVDVYLAS